MKHESLYLRNNVQIEPLINSWYAWSFLVSPVTFALVTRNLHLRVLESYLRAPEQHASAVRDPTLRGGLVVDHKGSMDQIKDLVERMKKGLADLLDLADDVSAFSSKLNTIAIGGAMSNVYESLPSSLGGRTELCYDLFNRPRLRFIESLFYKSAYYKRHVQSISLALVDGNQRPYVLSSPRFENDSNLIINIPFCDPAWDEFFATRHTPRALDEIKTLVGWDILAKDKQKLFLEMLTVSPPEKCYKPVGGDAQVRVRYFGHATVLIESNEASILTDPIISYDLENVSGRFGFKDLPNTIDYVVLTHNHQDHVMLETLLQLRHRIKIIVVAKNSGGELQDPSLKMMLQAIGFQDVRELGEMESMPIAGGSITGIPFLGEHGDLGILSKLAFHIDIKGITSLFAADSNNISPTLYEHVHRSIGDIDYIYIGMECAGAPMSWLYGPLFAEPLARKFDNARRLNGSNAERAIKLVKQFNPKAVYVYAMGAEPWLTFISNIEYTETSEPIIESDELISNCRKMGIEAERLYGFKEINIQ